MRLHLNIVFKILVDIVLVFNFLTTQAQSNHKIYNHIDSCIKLNINNTKINLCNIDLNGYSQNDIYNIKAYTDSIVINPKLIETIGLSGAKISVYKKGIIDSATVVKVNYCFDFKKYEYDTHGNEIGYLIDFKIYKKFSLQNKNGTFTLPNIYNNKEFNQEYIERKILKNNLEELRIKCYKKSKSKLSFENYKKKYFNTKEPNLVLEEYSTSITINIKDLNGKKDKIQIIYYLN